MNTRSEFFEFATWYDHTGVALFIRSVSKCRNKIIECFTWEIEVTNIYVGADSQYCRGLWPKFVPLLPKRGGEGPNMTKQMTWGGGHFNHRDWNPHRPTRPVTAYTLFREHTRDIDTWHFSDILRYHRQIGRKCYTAIHNSWKQIQGHIVVINISKKSMVTQYRNSSPITRVTVTYVLVDMYPVSDHFV